jgi:hypothetical protein
MGEFISYRLKNTLCIYNPIQKQPKVARQNLAPDPFGPVHGCIDGWHRLAAMKALPAAGPYGVFNVFNVLWPQYKTRF